MIDELVYKKPDDYRKQEIEALTKAISNINSDIYKIFKEDIEWIKLDMKHMRKLYKIAIVINKNLPFGSKKIPCAYIFENKNRNRFFKIMHQIIGKLFNDEKHAERAYKIQQLQIELKALEELKQIIEKSLENKDTCIK